MSGATAAHTGPAPAPSSADVAVIAALPIELNAFIQRARAKRVYQAARLRIVEVVLGKQIVVTVAAGVGQAAALRAVELMHAGHRPRWIISAGFCGALDSQLCRNDIVLPDQIMDPAGTSVSIDVHVGPASAPAAWRAGRLVTVDQIARTVDEKAELRARSGADIVDMESIAVARWCAQRNVRFLGVRVVSDDAQTTLPPELLTLVGPTGSYRVGAAVGALLKRPASIANMLRLREQAHAAADSLAAALMAIIPQLG